MITASLPQLGQSPFAQEVAEGQGRAQVPRPRRAGPSGSQSPTPPTTRRREAKSALAAELASEMLRTRGRIAELDRRLEELLAARPEAEIVRSLPGMGVVFTAEFLAEVGDSSRFASADSLAAAAGIAPVS